MKRLISTLVPCLALGSPGAAQPTQEALPETTPPAGESTAAQAQSASTVLPDSTTWAAPEQNTTAPTGFLPPSFDTSYVPPYERPTTQPLPPRSPNPDFGTGAFGSGPELPLPAAPRPGAVPPAAGSRDPLPLSWGIITFHPHVSYQMVYGSGLLSGPGREENSFQHTLSPGMTFNIGPRWRLDYTPSLKFYSSEGYEDTLDHAVSLNGSAGSAGWLFTLGHAYRSSSDALIETASQTSQDTHSTGLGASRSLTDTTTLELGLAQSLRFAEDYTDSYTWSTTDWLDKQLRPDFAVAVGINAAYQLMDPGTDMTSERLLGRVRGRALNKLGYSVEGGVEFRQFLDSDAPMKVSPTVNGSLSYQVFEPTTIGVFASHDIGTSYYTDQFTETTRVGGSLSQRLLGKIHLSVSGGYSFMKYSSTLASDTVVREDETPNFQAGLSTRLLRRGSVSVFYSWSQNASGLAGYSYDSNQIGFQLGYAL
ncbi:MAG: outer membrane beta-barrel protein [Verrucomicrobiales bacterium]|nr:outer membrane beta-barrel protein [Verrucomicrobiales bacterium]